MNQNCLADRQRRHRDLARRIAGHEAVRAADTLAPAQSTSAHPETELVVAKTRRGAAPASVLHCIADAGLELAEVQPANHPDYLRATVR